MSVHILETKNTIRKSHLFGLEWDRVSEAECMGKSWLGSVKEELLIEQRHRHGRSSMEDHGQFFLHQQASWLP